MVNDKRLPLSYIYLPEPNWDLDMDMDMDMDPSNTNAFFYTLQNGRMVPSAVLRRLSNKEKHQRKWFFISGYTNAYVLSTN